MIKTAKEWFEEELSGEPLTQESVIEVIQMVQLEAIEETVKLCAENAALKYADGKYCLPDYAEEPFNAVCDNLENCHYISRESILNCAEILKKQVNG